MTKLIVNHVQIKYKKKVEQLEKEKEDLKRQILVLKGDKRIRFNDKPLKKSLIDLYSEVLDELQDYDSPYDVQDMLPRVVVVGDQSAGKTSVLEMIANARIFPRGSGEMMTRSPVQVTLRQGPYHIAKFNDSEREYNLKDEGDLEKLRNEIEYRMKCNVKNGQTISSKVISLSIQGPNLKRMVLIDLPGIINTATQEMRPETKEEIKKMTNYYMLNPNSIILCIQDGSIDVEKSLVTDLVSKADPDGRRTIFVLTKIDLAERNWRNPDRLKKILDGKLFPMKALGYFGVITGKGRPEETIDEIKQYEDNFFKKSKLVREGILTLSKCTTSNLTEKVSDCFWGMVKSSVELQADTFRAIRFNLETQWRNEFPQSRELTREDLFEKAKSELLDEVVNLSLKKNQYWEEQIKGDLWNLTKDFVFDKVFFPSYLDCKDNLSKTKLEINLNELSSFMPSTSIQSATNVFLNEFKNLLLNQRKINYDEIFDQFKVFVCEERLRKDYKWESKAEEVLKIIQFVALQNNSIPDSNEWRSAVNNVQTVMREKLKELDAQINELLGPGYLYSWLTWSWVSKDQATNSHIKNELEKLLNNGNGPSGKYQLSEEDRKFVKTSLELIKVTASDEQVDRVWNLLVRKKILTDTLKKAYDCRGGFQYYQHGLLNEIECEDVILFWRIDKMLTSTASSLRMQLVDREYQRLHDILKDILCDVYEDKELLKRLFTGRRIKIVEELSKCVRDRVFCSFNLSNFRRQLSNVWSNSRLLSSSR